MGWRSYAPLMPHLAKAPVQQLALEFASREMAEIELVKFGTLKVYSGAPHGIVGEYQAALDKDILDFIAD